MVDGAGENIFSNLEIAPKFTPCRCFPYEACPELTSIPEYDVSGMNGIAEQRWFNWSANLQFFGGLKNVSGGCIDFWNCKKLTKASLLNILNKLEPVIPNSSIYRNGVLVFNAESYVKLTEEEIQIAIDKGWTVEYINF